MLRLVDQLAAAGHGTELDHLAVLAAVVAL
jgi:hypothetical protein